MSDDESGRSATVCSALSCLILAGGLATIGLAAYMVVVTYSSLPWSDGWIQIAAPARGEHLLSLRWLWQQHNEHRLIIPKLLLVADLRLFQATQVLLLASIFTIQLLHAALLSWGLWVLGGWRGWLWRSGTGLAAFCLFCPSQWENLVWGFQTCFVLPLLFATVSFLGLLLFAKASETLGQPSSKFILLSIGAALVATYSLANGNLLWPILIIAALLLRVRRSAILIYLIVGVASTALYLHNYVRPQLTSNPGESIRSPLQVLGYVAVYFGSAWTRQSIDLAMLCGVAGLFLALFFLRRSLRTTSAKTPLSTLLSLVLVFCVGTGLITALGRVAFGDVQAFSSRYQSVALLFWCCLGLLGLRTLTSGPRRIPAWILSLTLIAVLLRGADLARFPLRDAREHAFQQRAASAALLTEVQDREQIARADSNPQEAMDLVPYMREKRLSIFAKDDFNNLGAKVDSVFRVAPASECVGAVQSVEAVFPGLSPALRITGWAWDRTRREPPSYIVGVADGTIIGLGAVGDWRPTIRAANRELKTSFVGFTAYAKGIPPAATVNLYAVARSRPAELCPIAALTYSDVK